MWIRGAQSSLEREGWRWGFGELFWEKRDAWERGKGERQGRGVVGAAMGFVDKGFAVCLGAGGGGRNPGGGWAQKKRNSGAWDGSFSPWERVERTPEGCAFPVRPPVRLLGAENPSGCLSILHRLNPSSS